MVRLVAIAVLACGLGACAPDHRQNIREFNDDGLFLYQRGEFGHARESFEAALALRPNDPNLLYNIGECRVRAGQLNAAEQSFQECLKYAPDHPQCRHALASMLYDQGRREEAVRMVGEWMRHNPKLSSPYVEDAYLWHRYGDLPKARDQLQAALALNPRDPNALAELGRVFDDMNLTEQAETMYRRSLDSQPRQPDVAYRLASLHSRTAPAPTPAPATTIP
jgi:Tfp pilus assembly protein PilF